MALRSVDSKYYTKDYFLHECSDFKEFSRSFGRELVGRFKMMLPHLKIKPGTTVLDIGSGRGEMCLWAANQGAKVVGVDYSHAAIELASQALLKQPVKIQHRIKYIQNSVTNMTFSPHSFDYIISSEVLEHLYPEEIEIMLKKVKAYLKPGGLLIFHTAPNRWFNTYAYPFYCYPVGSLLVAMWNRLRRGTYPPLVKPSMLKTKIEQVMHVNEPTYFSLKAHFTKAGFKTRIYSTNVTVCKPEISWKDRLYNQLVYLIPLSRLFPFNIIWGNDFMIIARG